MIDVDARIEACAQSLAFASLASMLDPVSAAEALMRACGAVLIATAGPAAGSSFRRMAEIQAGALALLETINDDLVQ